MALRPTGIDGITPAKTVLAEAIGVVEPDTLQVVKVAAEYMLGTDGTRLARFRVPPNMGNPQACKLGRTFRHTWPRTATAAGDSPHITSHHAPHEIMQHAYASLSAAPLSWGLDVLLSTMPQGTHCHRGHRAHRSRRDSTQQATPQASASHAARIP
jgi:hypothetical protein